MNRYVAYSLAGIGIFCPIKSRCDAQAWLPQRGELTASAEVQRVETQGHFLDDGSKAPGYRTRATSVLFDLSYGITNRLALRVGLPFVGAKYLGPETPSNLPDNKLDDGEYHGTLTDVRLEVRGKAFNYPLAVTPFVAVLIPTHGYQTIGEAATGRGFEEFLLGTYAGRLVGDWLPGVFIHGMYSYAFVRQNLNIPLNRSNGDLAIGYVIAQTAQLSLLWRQQWAHGGLTFDELYASSPDVFRNLDRTVRERFQHVGVALALPVTESFGAHANFVKFVSGVDAHFGFGFSAGMSWTIQTRAQENPFARATAARDTSR